MPTTTPFNFLNNTYQLFNYYKTLGEKAMAQVPDAALFQSQEDQSA